MQNQALSLADARPEQDGVSSMICPNRKGFGAAGRLPNGRKKRTFGPMEAA